MFLFFADQGTTSVQDINSWTMVEDATGTEGVGEEKTGNMEELARHLRSGDFGLQLLHQDCGWVSFYVNCVLFLHPHLLFDSVALLLGLIGVGINAPFHALDGSLLLLFFFSSGVDPTRDPRFKLQWDSAIMCSYL
ncbi:hypothetical protein XELAEV_18028686mg [Xenopus laevis]|uniref:Uncharacterized protein n=1 Tax=Xenopus laevis TaxID=8355 RepID=A0A974CQ21_XENLA|nr:hypothetical protein XELAEV_18028686mg [Xenopus laevis]